MAKFRIRKRQDQVKHIFPIFDKYPLLTNKYYSYYKQKIACKILDNPNLTKEEKEIFQLYQKSIRINLPSPVWREINLNSNLDSVKRILSIPWLSGFIEAEGSFFIVLKENNRLVHAFGITQKLDRIVLENIRRLLHIKTKVQIKSQGHFSLETTNSRSIQNIIKQLTGQFKGKKSLEFKIWSRSYIKDKGNFNKLLKIRLLLRSIRSMEG